MTVTSMNATSHLTHATEPEMLDPEPVAETATLTVVKRRSYFSLVLAVVSVLITGFVALGLARNPYLKWSVVADYLFSPMILKGVVVTIELSVLSMLCAIVLGILIGIARMARNPMLSSLARGYIVFFRGVPVLVQLLIWGNIGLLVKTISLGVPLTDITFFSIKTNDLLIPFASAVIGLTLAEAAFMAEVVRAGIVSIDRGQLEAAAAIGMTPARTTRRIVLPQALRVMIPPTGNEFVNLIKGTSLVSVIAGGDLLTHAQNISATSYRIVEMLVVATVWYLVLVTLATIGQNYLEKAASRGFHA